MSRAHTFLRGSVFSAGAVLLSTVAMLGVWKLAANGLTQEAFALFLLFILAADFGNLLLGWGLAVTLPRLTAGRPEASRPALVGATIRSLAVSGLAVALVAVFVAAPLLGPWLAARDEAWADALPYVHWFLPLLVIGLLRDVSLGILAGENRYGLRAAAIVIAAAAYLVLTLYFVWYADGGMTGLLQATVLAYGTGLVLAAAGFPRGWLRAGHRADFTGAVRFSLPIHVNNLLSFAYQRADSLLVTAFAGLEALALYETAKRFPLLLSRGIGSLLVPYLPLISEMTANGETAKARELFNHVLQLVVVMTYGFVLVSAVFREPLIVLLTNEGYAGAAPVMVVLLAAMALTIQCGIAGQALIAVGRTLPITLANIGLIIISLCGNLALLPHFGIHGAAWAAVAAIAFSHGVQLAVVHRSGLAVAWRPYAVAQATFWAALALMFLAGDETLWRLAVLVLYGAATLLSGVLPWRALRLVLARPRA